MLNITYKNIALVFGIVFVVSGILGFIPNPLVYADGFFEVNAMHNMVHILTGSGFLAIFFLGAERTIRFFLQGVGIAYTGIAILGFLIEGNLLLGFVHINEADKWLHAGLAVLILAIGFGLPVRQKQAA